jgi:hypothetical protein
MFRLQLEKIYLPTSPVVGTSTRRNCPCCEETLNLAELDTPSPKIARMESKRKGASVNPNEYRILYKAYSSGNMIKVVRKKAPEPFSLANSHNITLEDFSRTNKKIGAKLSVNHHLSKTVPSKKNVSIGIKEKESNFGRFEDRSRMNIKKIDVLWRREEARMKVLGGLNSLQKIMRRANLPPLAKSIISVRLRRGLAE